MPAEILYSDVNNMKFILFFTRYAWVPQLIPILSDYSYYSWVTSNFEKTTKLINATTNTDVELCSFRKSNFYTNIWMFFVNEETLYVD